MAKDNRLWTPKKLRDWLKKHDIVLPKGSLVAPLTDGDGHYVVTIFNGLKGIPAEAQQMVLAVRRNGGYAATTYTDENLGVVSVEIDMFKSYSDRLENAQLSLRLEGDV